MATSGIDEDDLKGTTEFTAMSQRRPAYCIRGTEIEIEKSKRLTTMGHRAYLCNKTYKGAEIKRESRAIEGKKRSTQQ